MSWTTWDHVFSVALGVGCVVVGLVMLVYAVDRVDARMRRRGRKT